MKEYFFSNHRAPDPTKWTDTEAADISKLMTVTNVDFVQENSPTPVPNQCAVIYSLPVPDSTKPVYYQYQRYLTQITQSILSIKDFVTTISDSRRFYSTDFVVPLKTGGIKSVSFLLMDEQPTINFLPGTTAPTLSAYNKQGVAGFLRKDGEDYVLVYAPQSHGLNIGGLARTGKTIDPAYDNLVKSSRLLFAVKFIRIERNKQYTADEVDAIDRRLIGFPRNIFVNAFLKYMGLYGEGYTLCQTIGSEKVPVVDSQGQYIAYPNWNGGVPPGARKVDIGPIPLNPTSGALTYHLQAYKEAVTAASHMGIMPLDLLMSVDCSESEFLSDIKERVIAHSREMCPLYFQPETPSNAAERTNTRISLDNVPYNPFISKEVLAARSAESGVPMGLYLLDKQMDNMYGRPPRSRRNYHNYKKNFFVDRFLQMKAGAEFREKVTSVVVEAAEKQGKDPNKTLQKLQVQFPSFYKFHEYVRTYGEEGVEQLVSSV